MRKAVELDVKRRKTKVKKLKSIVLCISSDFDEGAFDDMPALPRMRVVVLCRQCARNHV